MTPERWRQITNIFESALRRDAAERAVFVAQACKGDDSLRRDVEEMLDSHEQASHFIEEPAMNLAAKLARADEGASLVGQRVLHYQVLSLLGAGGMGEVYLAEDTRLGRRVALKLLPEDLAQDEQRVNRFQQEARAVSSLNHPNILTIHEIGRVDSRHFITTEFIEGETLRQSLSRGTMGLSFALDVGVQIASALAEAHEAGIIHRDIKPENVMIRRGPIVKVLDFGLAKLTERSSSDKDARVNTEPGLLMGTANYMSPEQARGLEVDARTDIWSLGCVLYEMTARRVPFEGETPSDVLSLILQKEPPPLARFAPNAPEELARIVNKSLAKDREERYQTVKDLLIDLQRLRRRLDMEAELERSGRSSFGGDAAVTRSRAPDFTAAELPQQTSAAGAVHATSSAEYLVGEVRRHKLGVLLAVAVIALAAVAIFFYYSRASREIHSIAVLPLVNASGDPETEYLSEGITESLIDNLSQLPKLRVMSLNSVLRYKGREADAQAVGRALGVEAVVTGRVAQRGDGLVISVEMVDVRNNTRLWGGRYDRRLSDLLAVQGEISREVLEKLRLRLTGEEEKRATRRYTENAEAYQLYLKGRYHWNKRTADDLWKGLDHFRKAIELDANYALAYSGVADSYFALSIGGPFAPGSRRSLALDEARTKSLAAARRAVELDPKLAEAHTSLGAVLEWFEWDYAGAEREYKRALELNPDYASAYQRYGVFLATTDRLDEGIAQLKRALQLDPASLPINADLGFVYYNARRYDEAIEQLRKTVELDPDWPRAHSLLAFCYTQKGMYDEALRELQQMQLPGRGPNFARLYVLMGRRDEALKVLAEMKERSKQTGNVPHLGFVAIYTALGDKERAFEYLEKAFAERIPGLRNIKTSPVYDELRSDPRFADLLKRIGLPP
ncbi:MAG TPA: protein kinase [Pyrinomonadaceae bacterium]